MIFNAIYSRNQKITYSTQRLMWVFICITCFSTHVDANEVLKCLGREELKIHRAKLSGPQYQLNQTYLNELSSNNDLTIKSLYTKKVCDDPDFPPSVSLLRHIILYKRALFDVPKDLNRLDGLRSFKLAQLDDLINRSAEIFFQYISGVQALAPTADCLTSQIKSLSSIMERYHFLKSEVKPSELLNNKKQIQEVFDGLKNINNIYKICQRDVGKKRSKKLIKRKSMLIK